MTQSGYGGCLSSASSGSPSHGSLDQLPKLCPINRTTDLAVLREKFEDGYAGGRSDLPGIDVFVSTADPDKEPPLITANTILAADYPVDKLACYVSDDGGALLTFEAMAGLREGRPAGEAGVRRV